MLYLLIPLQRSTELVLSMHVLHFRREVSSSFLLEKCVLDFCIRSIYTENIPILSVAA